MALITATEVVNISFTSSSKNVEAMVKDAYISRAENDYIRPVLGDDLYDDIVANHSSGVNQTLYTEYLLPALAFYTKLLLLPDLNVKTTAQGLMVNSTEFGTQASSAMRAELATTTKQIADGFMKDAIKYIEINDTDFQLFYNGTTNPPVERKTIGGIIF